MFSPVFSIFITFLLLFVVPFIPITAKLFRYREFIHLVYHSMIMGLATAMTVSILLYPLGGFTKTGFLLAYFSVLLIFYSLFMRELSLPLFPITLDSSTFILLSAFLVGAYFRLYWSLTNVALGGLDPYSHLSMTKNLLIGDFFGGFDIESYPRGLHIILSLLHFYSGESVYSVVKFAGPIFGLLSIGAVCLLMSHIFGRLSGALAALAYSGPWYMVPSSWWVLERQTITIPESLSLLVMALSIFYSMKILERASDDQKIGRDAVFLLFLSYFVLVFIHHVTMIYTASLLILFLVYAILVYSPLRENKKRTALMGLLFLSGMIMTIIYYVLTVRLLGIKFGHTLGGSPIDFPLFLGTINEALPDYLSLSWDMVFIILLAFMITAYGAIAKSFKTSLIGLGTLLFGFMASTNTLVIYSNPGRAQIYFMFTSSCVVGLVIAKLLNKRDFLDVLKSISNVRWLRPFSAKLTEIFQKLYPALVITLFVGYILSLTCIRTGYNKVAIVILGFGLGFSNYVILGFGLGFIVGLIYMAIKRIKKKGVALGKKGIDARGQRKLRVVFTLAFLLILILHPPPAPEEYFEENVQVLLKISETFPIEDVTVYSETLRKDPSATFNLEKFIIEPGGRHKELGDLLCLPPSDFEPNSRFTFIFLEKIPNPLRTIHDTTNVTKTLKWIQSYGSKGYVSTYYESERILVYLFVKSERDY